MDRLNCKLRDRAITLGLCQQWQGEWMDGKSKDELVEMYVRGLDFCIEHNYPSNDFIAANFEPEVLHRNGVWLNERVVTCGVPNSVLVLNGCCTGVLKFGGYDVCTIYVRHDSEVEINADGVSKVFISVFDNAKVKVKQSDLAKVYVYKHGDKCVVGTDGDVRMRTSE
jgi:hypothetical protein|nr:MAG TPA: hypothetical protein [Caudoviricetes sp.]